MPAKSFKDWGRTGILLAAVMLVLVLSSSAIFAGWKVRAKDPDLQKSLYTGGATLFFGGLLGGLVKLLLDDVVAAKRKREDAATFVTNVLADLKSVYDRVARARILIPAHKSVKTYGEEMRDLIEARVQLRNVTRALERRAEGVDEEARKEIIGLVSKMGEYLETLTTEFRDHYKVLSDKQRGYEERAKVILKHFAEAEGAEPPKLPEFVWESIARLEKFADFIGEGKTYQIDFEGPLDDASELLRSELARILGSRSRVHTHVGTSRSSAALKTDAPQ